MNYAVIFGGGIGARFGSNIPKQFLEINGIPIIIYTIEKFEQCDDIDKIVVVCKTEWIDHLIKKLEQFCIKKVVAVVDGSDTAFKSIFNGLTTVKKLGNADLVLVHDAVRPLIDEKAIAENIRTAKEHDNAICYSPAIETIAVDDIIVDREFCRLLRAPQTFNFKQLYDAFDSALKKHETFIDCASLMSARGYKLNLVECNSTNIKITTDIDFKICKLYLN